MIPTFAGRRADISRRLPLDPWNRPYLYASPGRRGEVDVYTLGRDGQEGGEGQDADIGNWNLGP